MFRFCAVTILSCMLSACAFPGKYRADGTPDYKWNYARTYLDTRVVSEVSGAALSSRSDNYIWLINDSGDGPNIYAIGLDGRLAGTFEIEGAKNIDWEDISSFKDGEQNIIVVADVGDNLGNRQDYTLYFIEEPDIQESLTHIVQKVRPRKVIRFQYEDGAKDSEAVSVDTQQRRVLIASKRLSKNNLYSVPLDLESDEVFVANKVTELSAINQSNRFFFLPSDKQQLAEREPTGMDISPDNRLLTILTYSTIFLFEKTDEEHWEQALNRKPVSSFMPVMKQPEAIAFGRDSRKIFVLSEQLPTVIVTLTRDNEPSFVER